MHKVTLVRESKMKSVTQIREELVELSENVESSSDVRKLTALVRAGLFDPNKLTMLKRALNKDNIKMTRAERDALLELLDRLLNVVMANQGTFMKVKQSISEATKEDLNEAIKAKANSDIDITQIPPLIVMKRKAIRVFPDGQKVALYWADRINKYISVPFQSIGISEETEINEISQELASRAYAKRKAQSKLANNKIDDEDLSQDELKKLYRIAQNANAKSNKTMTLIKKRETAGKYDKDTSEISKLMSKKEVNKTKELAKQEKELAKQKAERDTTGSFSGDYKAMRAKGHDRSVALGTALGAAIGHGHAIPGLSKGKKAVAPNTSKLKAGMMQKQMKLRESKFRDRLEALREARQYGAADAALDAASFIPGPAGSAASLASAGMSLSRGDYVGAALDTLGAIPILGYGAKALKLARKGSKIAKAASGVGKAEKAAKTAKTGKSSKLGKAANLGGAGLLGANLASGGSSGDSGSSGGSGSSAIDTSSAKVDVGPAFKGSSLKGTDSFSSIGKGSSAQDARMKSMQTASSRAMSGRSTAVSESAIDEGKLDFIKNLFRKSGKPTPKPKKPTKKPKKDSNVGSNANAFGAGMAAGDMLDGNNAGAGSSSNKPAYERPNVGPAFKGSTLQGTDSFSKRGAGNSAEAARRHRMDIAASRAMTGRSTAVSEETINRLRVISETRQPMSVDFSDGSSLDVSRIMASKLVETYDAMNKDNKKLFQEMINKDKASFMKLFKFASKQ